MKALLSLLLVFAASHAFAAEFVQQPLFLSKSPVNIGDKVRIYAIVDNEGSTTFIGSVPIDVDGTVLGAPTSTLAVGATQTVYVRWIPTTGGDHLITAQLVADDGTIVQKVSQTFPIILPPPPPAVEASDSPATASTSLGTTFDNSTYQSSSGVQQALASISPALATDTKSIFNIIDGARSGIATILNNQIVHANTALGYPQSSPKSTTTVGSTITHSTKTTSSTTSSSNQSHGFFYYLWNLYLYLLLILRFLVNNAFYFYPILVLIFFYVMWRIYKKMSRRDY